MDKSKVDGIGKINRWTRVVCMLCFLFLWACFVTFIFTVWIVLSSVFNECSRQRNGCWYRLFVWELPSYLRKGQEGFPGGAVVKNLPATVGDTRNVGLIPEWGRYHRVGNGNPLQYSFLKDSMDREAWRPTVHRIAKTWTQLSNWVSTHVLIMMAQEKPFMEQ